MIGARYVCLFTQPSDLPRRFVMIWLGSQVADVFEEGVFPLPMRAVCNTPIEKRSFATLFEKMERVASLQEAAEPSWITLSDVHPTVTGVGPHARVLPGQPFPEQVSPFLPTPIFDFPALVAKACWAAPLVHLFLARTSSGDFRLKVCVFRIVICCVLWDLIFCLVVAV